MILAGVNHVKSSISSVQNLCCLNRRFRSEGCSPANPPPPPHPPLSAPWILCIYSSEVSLFFGIIPEHLYAFVVNCMLLVMNCIICILLSVFVGSYTLSLRLIKQHLGDHRFRNNEEVDITVREWLRMQGPDFCSDGIFKTRDQRGKMHQCARELR